MSLLKPFLCGWLPTDTNPTHPLLPPQGANICFSLRADVCTDLSTLCNNTPNCLLALGNQSGQSRDTCCPTQRLPVPADLLSP